MPVTEWILAEYKSKWVEVSGVEDNRQITATFAASLTGTCLPVQLVYQDNVMPPLIFPTIGTSPTYLTTGAMKIP